MRTPVASGWLARQEAAKRALAEREGGYHPVASSDVDRSRRELYAAKAEADRLAQETAQARITNTVSVCPCCAGKGHVAVPDAAKVVEALNRYNFVGWAPSVETISELMRSAITVDRDGKPVAVQTTVGTVTVSGTDADLAAVADAVREQIAPASETAKPAKAQRKRVAPPFLAGDE